MKLNDDELSVKNTSRPTVCTIFTSQRKQNNSFFIELFTDEKKEKGKQNHSPIKRVKCNTETRKNNKFLVT